MNRDHIIILCTTALAVGYLYATTKIPSLDTVDPLGPRAYPYLVAAGLIGSVVWLLLESVQSRKVAVQAEDVSERESETVDNKRYIMLSFVVVSLGIYYAAIEAAGFVVSTVIFLVSLTAYFNPGKWVANILVSFIFAVGVYVLFTHVLGVPLAKGLLDI
ncbi:tripartite tricarboxylate transporter TctB family protein [Borborobacter arsenicus]|uniref:tripartite tricarboxylate transporter TctB family protein n=1 Tax=Borborobacter arsenicus TaxID=1851146 RepID=UPI0014049E67|nr:tripartite tricarboxylate transporter TctB family protein [Pseudaminobacter arsenicus]